MYLCTLTASTYRPSTSPKVPIEKCIKYKVRNNLYSLSFRPAWLPIFSEEWTVEARCEAVWQGSAAGLSDEAVQ